MERPATRAGLAADLAALGLGPGDTVMVHAALRRVGPMLGGPDDLILALLDATAPGGTVMAYTDWEAPYLDHLAADGSVPADLRPHVPPFDVAASRAVRANGAFAELLRTRPGALRSGNPGASCVALGARSLELTSNHPLDYGYGPGSPFARLVALGGKVAMIGAPLDTMTLLHHAEHLAPLRGKRVVRVEVPLAGAGGTEWLWIEEFDTADPVVAGLSDDVFGEIVADYLAKGEGRRGLVGRAPSVVVEAARIVPFAVGWLERRVQAMQLR